MSEYATELNAIIIGAGPSGISMAYRLKHDLDFHDFTIFEKLDGVGGTWRTNTYPGCGCDLKSHLYSFSFNPNPYWSKELCEQPEILQYMEDTVDKFDIRKHVQVSVECIGARWDSSKTKWEVQLRDLQSGIEYTRIASVLVSGVGAISYPREIAFPGMDSFQGPIFHTARWDHSVDYSGQRVAVIGNGCSAAQVVPALVAGPGAAKSVTQYARSAQWFHERPNRAYSRVDKALFAFVPLYERLLRLRIFWDADAETLAYFPSPQGQRVRKAMEAEARQYIRSRAPEKYWPALIPDFPLGCKRRIFDPGYLDALHRADVELVAEGIRAFTPTGLVSAATGRRDDFDVVVLATGFQVSEFLTPMHIVGAAGTALHDQWRECRGAQAYLGTFVHNFPNLAILFGPNTFPANNSALFACEVQAAYATKALFAPLLDGRARVVEVKQAAEDALTASIHRGLAQTVFAGDCSNWYIGKYGRNAASWPGFARSFWAATLFPDWSAFNMHGGVGPWWRVRWLVRHVTSLSPVAKVLLVAAVVAVARGGVPKLGELVQFVRGTVTA